MGCCSFVLHGFMELGRVDLNGPSNALETPRWGVSRARGTGCSNCVFCFARVGRGARAVRICSFTAQEQHLMGCCSFVLHGFMEQRSGTPRWGVSGVPLVKRPGGAFLGRGARAVRIRSLLHQEQHLMGCCSFVLHGFYGAGRADLNRRSCPRNAPVGRF